MSTHKVESLKHFITLCKLFGCYYRQVFPLTANNFISPLRTLTRKQQEALKAKKNFKLVQNYSRKSL